MTRIQMMDHITHLRATFGEKHFSGAKLEFIWKYCEDVDAWQFKKITEHFISTFRQPPLPKDFRDAVAKERAQTKTYPADRIQFEWRPKCENCLDCGFVNIQIDPDHELALVFAKCDCDIWSEKNQRKSWSWVSMPSYKQVPQYRMIPMDGKTWKPEGGTKGLWAKAEVWKEKMNISIQFWKETIQGGSHG